MQSKSMKIGKLLKIGILILLCLFPASVLLFETYTLALVHTEGHAPLPKNFGNFDSVIALLTKQAKPEFFSFAVAGDTRGKETFETILHALKDEPLSFVVLLGDCINVHESPGAHDFLRVEMAEELSTPYPVFYVVGNHDVAGKEFSMSDFEKVYGPTNFYFTYRGCLFIGLCSIGKPYEEKSLAFLESTLASQRNTARRAFVFMHIPPPISSGNFAIKKFKASEKFISLFDKYHVDYVFAGHYHGYAKVQSKNTVYIVSGGGGAKLAKQGPGRFYHAIVVKVYPDSVSENILKFNSQRNLEDNIELYALATFYPWVKKNLALAVLLNVGIIVFCIAVFIWFLKLPRLRRLLGIRNL